MNNKQILLAIIVIVVALFLWFSLGNHLPIESQIAKQTINYSDFNITKTITFSENDRAEEYSFDLKNPIAAYLLLPKELISKASTIKLTGDFNAQIINDDPLIELIPFSYNPGVKKIKIQFADTNKQLTSILFALPFTNFNELTPEQKATLEDGIKELQANSSIENYFITNSQTVMQQFANNQKSAGLQKGTIPIRISFSQTIDPQQILTSLSTILKKKNNQ